MARTKIEWTQGPNGEPGVVWNPIRGCSRVSEGCRRCWAEQIAARFSGGESWMEPDEDELDRTLLAPAQAFHGFAEHGKGWTGNVALLAHKLDEPLRWRKARRVFVNSMSDLFHEGLTNEEIAAVFGVMVAAQRHTFLVLTKRPKRMRRWSAEMDRRATEQKVPLAALCFAYSDLRFGGLARRQGIEWKPDGTACVRGANSGPVPWPLPNVWLGVSVEDQKTADERIPLLLQTPAAVRFVSVEPMLGAVDLVGAEACEPPCGPPIMHVDWVIVGGESGPGARPCKVEWIRSVVEQCRAAGVPVFVKQDNGLRPGMQGRIPDELWIKEFPNGGA